MRAVKELSYSTQGQKKEKEKQWRSLKGNVASVWQTPTEPVTLSCCGAACLRAAGRQVTLLTLASLTSLEWLTFHSRSRTRTEPRLTHTHTHGMTLSTSTATRAKNIRNMHTVLMHHWPIERKAKSHSLSTHTHHCLAVVQWILQRSVITLSQAYRTSQQENQRMNEVLLRQIMLRLRPNFMSRHTCVREFEFPGAIQEITVDKCVQVTNFFFFFRRSLFI